MKHRHLGPLDGPVLLFGGPYSNLQATQALLSRARADGISPDHIICTGDVVAYCGAPVETVQAIRGSGCAVVAGNCEKQLGSGAQDCGCGFEEGSACDVLSVAWFGYASNALAQPDKDWMADLPDIVTFDHNGARYAVIHGGMSDIAQFVWPTSDQRVFDKEWRLIETAVGPVDHVVAGHCGLPFVRDVGGGPWINAGVVGMPPHDGSRETRYVTLTGGSAQICTLHYDAESAALDMARAGLPDGYRQGLLTGYWPSEDVLPADLRLSVSARG